MTILCNCLERVRACDINPHFAAMDSHIYMIWVHHDLIAHLSEQLVLHD